MQCRFQYFWLISKANYKTNSEKTYIKYTTLIIVSDLLNVISPHLATHEILGFTLATIITNLKNQELAKKAFYWYSEVD